jgi:hypothetical protein
VCATAVLAAFLLADCGGTGRPVWHDTTLPSGRTIKVTSFNLVWGVEHDDRDPSKDSFALEYVMTDPDAGVPQREAEAADVFELVRAASEQWGFRTASVAAFRQPERKGRYDLYLYTRQADGHWSRRRSETKVFVTD